MLILVQYFGAVMISLLQPCKEKNEIDTLEDLEKIIKSDLRIVSTYETNFYKSFVFESNHTNLHKKLNEYYKRFAL